MPATRYKQLSWRLLRGGLIVYLVLLLVLSALQAKLIFPGAVTQGQPEAIVRESPGTELAKVDTAEGQIALLFVDAHIPAPADSAGTTPTILFFYGNGMCLADCMPIADDLRRRGNNVILVDYPGYGMSGGEPSETGVYTAAATVYEFAIHRRNIDPRTIVPIGLSLGTAAAVDIASKKPVAGVVLLSPFTSMTDMARRIMPLFPTSLILKHRFENESKLREMSVPLFIAHGSQDTIIPVEMSDRLAVAGGGNVRVNLRLQADHNDLLLIGGDDLMDQISAFARDCVAQAAARQK